MDYYLLPWQDPRTKRLPQIDDTGTNGSRLLLDKSSSSLLHAGHYFLFAIKGSDGVSWLALWASLDSLLAQRDNRAILSRSYLKSSFQYLIHGIHLAAGVRQVQQLVLTKSSGYVHVAIFQGFHDNTVIIEWRYSQTGSRSGPSLSCERSKGPRSCSWH